MGREKYKFAHSVHVNILYSVQVPSLCATYYQMHCSWIILNLPPREKGSNTVLAREAVIL